jgi:hypothetical protein
MDMKKTKKHIFTHRDPEAVKVAQNTKPAELVDAPKNDELTVIKRDLTKTVLTILAFVAIVVVLYLIQTKTGLLKPVLRIFGL